MARQAKHWYSPTLLGMAVGLSLLAAAAIFPAGMLRLQIAASDALLLAEGGPQLGRRPPPADILLVLYDDLSRQVMQNLPTYEQDLKLYEQLLAAGARCVVDTRMIADGGGEEAAEIHRFLERLIASGHEGRLYRDIWVASQLPAEFLDAIEPYIANNVLNMHPNADSFSESRLYPLAMTLGERFRETLPLVVARAIAGNDRPTSAETLAQVKGSGISAAWQKSLGEGFSLHEELRADDVAPQPYRLADTAVPWNLFPSKSPSVLPAGYWICYDWSPADFARVSYAERPSPKAVKDQIVLVGYDLAIDPTSDTYRVPSLARRASAAEMIGCALQTLLAPRLLRAIPTAVTVGAVQLLAVLAAAIGAMVKPLRAMLLLGGILGLWCVGVVAGYRAGWFADMVLTPSALILAGGVGGGYRYWSEVRWRLRIVDLFGRYVPRAVVTQLVQQPDAEALSLGGVKRDVTVLFADIRGFTPFAERYSPEEVIEQLNSMLRILVDCTFAQQGTVDKFIGDAILVLFNAPLDQENHEALAARTALAMQEGISRHPSGLAVGIGIHRGAAVVGRVGTPERMEYTAIGSTVNVASRLCSAAPSGKIVVSEPVAEILDDQEFHLVRQPPLAVKGVEEMLQTFLLEK